MDAMDTLRELVRWANREGYRAGAPLHGHDKPGYWDDDEGNRKDGKAGKLCKECAVWNRARYLVRTRRA